VLIPQEAVIHVTCVDVISRNRPRWVDVVAGRALAGACAGPRSIERRGERAVGSTQVAADRGACVKDETPATASGLMLRTAAEYLGGACAGPGPSDVVIAPLGPR
jgi:hypothetical protein